MNILNQGNRGNTLPELTCYSASENDSKLLISVDNRPRISVITTH